MGTGLRMSGRARICTVETWTELDKGWGGRYTPHPNPKGRNIMSDGYNGWKNWETWNLVLWMNNDEGISQTIDDNIEWFIRCFGKGLSVDQVKEQFESWVLADPAFRIPFYVLNVHCTFPTGFTPDGVKINSSKIEWNEVISALVERFDERFVQGTLDQLA
jgi:hypothetical protein